LGDLLRRTRRIERTRTKAGLQNKGADGTVCTISDDKPCLCAAVLKWPARFGAFAAGWVTPQRPTRPILAKP